MLNAGAPETKGTIFRLARRSLAQWLCCPRVGPFKDLFRKDYRPERICLIATSKLPPFPAFLFLT